MITDYNEISLVPAASKDKELIFKWRNTPFLIGYGSSGRAVTWSEHSKWFQSVLDSNSTTLFVINLKDIPIGQLRFDVLEGDIYIISIYIIEEFTGKGIGGAALKKGISKFICKNDKRKCVAFIKADNNASKSFFLRAGFALDKSFAKVPHGHVAMKYNPE